MNGRAARTRRTLEATATLAGVKAGDFVSWRASKGTGRGQVVSVHTASHVPGVPARVEGSSARPAAKVRLYAKSKDGWSATDVHVGMHADKLTSIDALALAPEPAAEGYAPGSLNALRLAVRDAITALLEQTVGMCPYVGLEDIGPDWVVYEVGNGMWMCDYTQATDGTITLGSPVQVVELTQWVPADGSGPGVVGVDEEELDEPETVPMYMGEARADTLTGRLLAAKGTDAATGARVFRVEILRYGESKNGRNYPASVMQSAAGKYEGAKAFDHHRTDAELASSTVQGLVGTYRNVVATGTALEADFVLMKDGPALHVAEAFDMALANAAGGHGTDPFVGISHDVMARYRAVAGAGGKQLVEATEIVSVNSADVVAHPAAGGQATRMVASQDPTNPPTGGSVHTVKQLLTLLRESPVAQRDALLAEHAPTLEASGLDKAEALRLADSIVAPTAATTTTTTEVVATVLTGIMRRTVIREAVAAAKLPNPDRLVDRFMARLPESCTEAQVTAAVEDYQQAVEGLELADLEPRVPDVKVTQESADKKSKALDAFFDGNYREGYRSFKTAFADITGYRGNALDLEDYNRRILQECIAYVPFGRSTESLDSTSFAQLLGDSITRRLMKDYAQPNLQSWRALVSDVVPINDFRTQRIGRLGGYGTLPDVAEAGTYQALTSPGDEEATYAVTKRGGLETLTMEMIANDDIRAIAKIPTKLGLAAAQTLYRFLWKTMFADAPTCTYDSVALFHSGHSNTTSTALSTTALEVTRKNMRKQAAYGDTSDILSIIPKTLVTVPTLEPLASEIVNSPNAIPSGAPAGAATNIPNLHYGMDLVILDFYDATSTTAWFVIADTSMCPTIELGFYNGRQDPELFVQADPLVGSVYTADTISYKIRHIYSAVNLDHRGVSRGNV